MFLVERIHAGAIHENWSTGEGGTVEKFVSHGRNPKVEQGKSVTERNGRGNVR